MATMKEVALRAGVSTATVSRVINQTSWVEPVTRERVEKAMRELNYRRNAAALALATRSGNMLGLLTGNLADPFFARLASGVEEITRRNGFRLMMCSGEHKAEQEKLGLDFLINQGCEAIVVHSTLLSDEQLIRYCAHSPAMVLVNRYIPSLSSRCVWLDNKSASKAATEHLLQNGHHYIACVTADLEIYDRQQRIDGYKQAMDEKGIAISKEWIISVPFVEEGGEKAAKMLLKSRIPFTAAFTFNDVIAAGMMRSLRLSGIRLPEDFSLVGFDDIVLARHLFPALTTVHYPVESMARRATSLAIRLVQQADIPPQPLAFSAELVIRDSVYTISDMQTKLT